MNRGTVRYLPLYSDDTSIFHLDFVLTLRFKMAETRRRQVQQKRAPAVGLTDEDLQIFAQFGASPAPVAMRTRKKLPLEEEAPTPATNAHKMQIDTPSTSTNKRVSGRIQAKTTSATTAQSAKKTSAPQAKATATPNAKRTSKRDLPATAPSHNKSSNGTPLTSPAKNTHSNPTSPKSRPQATTTNSTKSTTAVSPSAKKSPKKDVKPAISAASPNSSSAAKKAGASNVSPKATAKRVKSVSAVTPERAPTTKNDIKLDVEAISPTRLSSAEKKRGRNSMTKMESTQMVIVQPVTIVAPPVTKGKLPSLPSKASSKPPKKKAKLAEAPSAMVSKTSPPPKPVGSWATQLIASQPRAVLPNTLSKKNGVYDWRESDCEEARFYQYCRVWHTQPSHTEAWRNDGANQSEVRENTYGEVTPEGMMPLFEELKFDAENDIFLDIGSGLGNLVFYASFVKRARKAYGIEILLSRHNAQLEIRDDLALLGDASWDPSSCQFVHTTHHDLNLCPGIETMLGESTIIFCNNLLFSPSSNTQCLTAIQNLATSAKYVVFTSPPLPRDSKRNPAFLRLWRTFEAYDACSWCAKPLTYYVYRPYYLMEGQTNPLPLFRYAPLPLTANSWGLDPFDVESPAEKASSEKQRELIEGKKKIAKSRFLTEYATISVPEQERRRLKELRREGIPKEGITSRVALKTKPNSKGGSSPSPTPLHNLKGERISFLVPYVGESEKSYPQMVYDAFNSARICANRDSLTV